MNKDYESELKKINKQIEMQQPLRNDYITFSRKYRDAVKSEISLLKQKKDLLEEQSEVMITKSKSKEKIK
jgi:hypothetical protein